MSIQGLRHGVATGDGHKTAQLPCSGPAGIHKGKGPATDLASPREAPDGGEGLLGASPGGP